MSKNRFWGAAIAIAVLIAGLVGVEAALRVVDRYSLRSVRLVRLPAPAVPMDELASWYIAQLPVASSVDRRWFPLDPSFQSGGSQTSDTDLYARASAHGGLDLAAVYEWNEEYLRWAICEQGLYEPVFRPLGEVFAFAPPVGGRFPSYRFLRRASLPSGLVTNSFGWRGPDLALEKPPGTIRIAFVGSSTTVNPHGDRMSYPDYVGRWLNVWAESRTLNARFEVINAGREGIDSSSIAAIVRDELAPVDPDLVVYYEGANTFPLTDFVVMPEGIVPGRPAEAALTYWPFEDRSALVVRLRGLVGRSTLSWREPHKPALTATWPASLSESDPALHDPRLPLNLRVVQQTFDTMRAALEPSGSHLAVSSFLWCVFDGLLLDPAASAGLHRFLNVSYWPYSYTYLRRMADLQNRVFAKYATEHDLDFIDVAKGFPLDPRLFGDAVHMVPLGIKLMAWATFQRLVPVVERRLAAGEWPRPARLHLAHHPAFEQPVRRLVRIADIRASCGSGSASKRESAGLRD